MSSATLLGACSFFPTNGPAALDIYVAADNPYTEVPYALVHVDRKVNGILAAAAPRLSQFLERGPHKAVRYGDGDVLSITVFEASAGGLFIPSEAGVRPGNFVTFPTQAVDLNGNISVPFAGEIRARGRTQVEVQKAIVDALKDRAIEPQVLVSLVDQRTSLISVFGDVGKQGRIPMTVAPEKIVDTITRAGGLSGPAADSWVMLERHGRRGVAPFGALLFEPKNNVQVQADDVIYVYKEPQTFVAFGALGSQQQIPFGAWHLSLAEALSKAGGFVDAQANPASLFIYRGEPRDIAEALGVDCSRFTSPLIPVIYQVNMREASGYFLASSFEMRNKDVIYASNALSVESTKFLNYVSTLNSTVQGPIATTTAVYGLRNIIRGTGQVPSVVTTGASTTTVVTPPPAGP